MPIAFATHTGFPPKYSHARRTPWSVFQDGSIKGAVASGSASVSQRRRYIRTHHSPFCPPTRPPATQKHCSSADIPTLPRAPQNASLSTISRTFHSLFKVLFIFPSRYLFAIGLLPLFSLRWNLPPLFELHSQAARLTDERQIESRCAPRGCHPLRRSFPEDSNTPHPSVTVQTTTQTTACFQCWAPPASLAVTEGILVSFFSSAY